MRTDYPHFLLPAAFALAGCALSEASVLLTTDRDTYTHDPSTGVAAVELTLHNGSAHAIATEGCATTIPLGYQLARQTSTGWQYEASNLRCAPPTFAGVTVQPGADHATVLHCCSQSGVYRVTVLYHLAGEYTIWDSTPPRQFVVQ
jgi:hypothetical protein